MVKDQQEAFAALRAGWVDIYLHDAPTSWQLANSLENDDLISLFTPMTEEMLAWAVAPDNEALQRQLELQRLLRQVRLPRELVDHARPEADAGQTWDS